MFELETEDAADDACHIIVAKTDVPIESRCAACDSAIESGSWVVLIAAAGTLSFLGRDDPLPCCTDTAIRMRIFASKEDAVDAYEETVSRIDDEGLDAIPLVEAPRTPGLVRDS